MEATRRLGSARLSSWEQTTPALGSWTHEIVAESRSRVSMPWEVNPS